MKCDFGHAPQELIDDPSILKVSPTAIMEFLKSPQHYFMRYIKGIKKRTKVMEQGTQVHMAFLESEKFFQTYCREPNRSDFPNSLATQEEWKAIAIQLGLKVSGKKDELKQRIIEADPSKKELDWDFIVENATQGKQIITDTDWESIQGLKTSLEYNVRLKNLFERQGWFEQLAWIYDDENKILYKFKWDFFDHTGLIVDIKKTPSARMSDFSKKLYHENLYVQAAMYFDLITLMHMNAPHLNLPKPRAFIFAAFEMASPYVWGDYSLDAGAMDAGEQRYKKAIMRLLECRANDVWPGYHSQMQPISLPHYAWDQLQYEADQELADGV